MECDGKMNIEIRLLTKQITLIKAVTNDLEGQRAYA